LSRPSNLSLALGENGGWQLFRQGFRVWTGVCWSL
jgi:hypothetical protein